MIAMVGKAAYMRGGSRSTRPVSKRAPNWVVYQPDEVKALIINLAREGKPQSTIGNKSTKLRRHLDINPKDFSNKRGFQITEAKIYALTRYYKKKGALPRDWNHRNEIVTI